MRNKLYVLMSLPILLLSACNNAKENKDYIGIISAMDNEISLLLEEAKIDEEKTIGGINFYIGTLRNKPVVITRAGIGKVRASSGVKSFRKYLP